ncbi:MAG: NADP-dependent phosphogluconate dehydrogenase [Rhizobiales bacterium]|nr:NADP-dependent phosphogluconate dehydrogenase [Hyphomicrobiales bacterium]
MSSGEGSPQRPDGIMNDHADIGLIGLAVMGQNLALNIADHGHRIAVFNRSSERTKAFVDSAEAKGRPLVPTYELAEFVGAIKRPRAIIMMVKAGEPVDQQIAQLLPHLEPSDVLVDGGNALYWDTIRREMALREEGILFVGTGISGGEEGARHGPSIMAGGDALALGRVAMILEAISAKVDDEPCYAHIGSDGAGHFVKMMHNGIEYADMQLIAEAYALMKGPAALSYPEMRSIFAGWNQGELDSYLIEITADILGKTDPETGRPMAEMILDRAGQKGTGGWAVQAALDHGSTAPTIAAAVEARTLSSMKAERVAAAVKLNGPAGTLDLDVKEFVDQLELALLASKVCAYAQGFAVMDAAAASHGWRLNKAEIASIWRGGCIIRARFLRHIRKAYERDPGLPNLMLDPYFAGLLERAQPAWRAVVALGIMQGIALPAFSSALAYYDGYRSALLPANLIQAQRDYFGAHTYERTDREGVFHTDWSA